MSSCRISFKVPQVDSSFRCACITFFAADPRKVEARRLFPKRPFMRVAQARILRTRSVSSSLRMRGDTTGEAVRLLVLRLGARESSKVSAFVRGALADAFGAQFPHVPHCRL